MIVQEYLDSINESQEVDISPFEANHLLSGFK